MASFYADDTPVGILDIRSETREMLTKERAADLLAEAETQTEGGLESVTAIHFGTKSFGEDAAVVAAATIAKMPKLVLADLADIIAGRPEDEALRVLRTVCGALPAAQLLELDLSDNALGEKGVRALESVFRSTPSLCSTVFMNNGLSKLSLELLSEYFSSACAPALRRLHFDNNMSGDGGAEAIASLLPRCVALEDFRMSSSRVRVAGGSALAQALPSVALTLRSLNLEDSMFGEEGGQALAAALTAGKMPCLTRLVLRDTGLEEEGLSAVLGALESSTLCPALEILDLACLEITPELVLLLEPVLRSKPAMRELILEENELASEGAVALANWLKEGTVVPALRVLDLRTNQIGRNGALAVAKATKARPELKLELDSNQIAEKVVEEIKELLDEAQLGSLDENEEDLDEDEDEDDVEVEDEDAGEVTEKTDDGGLADAMASLKV